MDSTETGITTLTGAKLSTDVKWFSCKISVRYGSNNKEHNVKYKSSFLKTEWLIGNLQSK